MSENSNSNEQPKNQLVPYEQDTSDNHENDSPIYPIAVIDVKATDMTVIPEKENKEPPLKDIKQPVARKKFIPNKGALVSAFSGVIGGAGLGSAFTMGTMALGGGTGDGLHTSIAVAGVAAVSAIVPKKLTSFLLKETFNKKAFIGSLAGAAMLTTGGLYNDSNMLEKEFFHKGVEQIQNMPKSVLKGFGIKIN